MRYSLDNGEKAGRLGTILSAHARLRTQEAPTLLGVTVFSVEEHEPA